MRSIYDYRTAVGSLRPSICVRGSEMARAIRGHIAATCFVAAALLMSPESGGAASFCTDPASDITDSKTIEWIGKLLSALGEAQGCDAVLQDQAVFEATSACNIFVGRVLDRVYGVRDFIVTPPDPDHPFFLANEIATLLHTWDNWSKLGTADDPDVRRMAKSSADLGKLVLAVWRNAGGPGHVALVGPGPMTPSASWGPPGTPPSSSFVLHKPQKAYLGKPLACAFTADTNDEIEMWVHK